MSPDESVTVGLYTLAGVLLVMATATGQLTITLGMTALGVGFVLPLAVYGLLSLAQGGSR